MQHTFLFQGSSIHFRVTGSGKPVVLLHGFGEDGHIWDEQVASLSDHGMVIVPDLPGSGQSGILAGEERGITDYADCIRAMLQTLDLESCMILGHSMGGYIALAFAEKYPAMVQAIGLVNSTAFADSEEKKQLRSKAIDTIGHYGAAAFLKTTIPGLFGKSFKTTYPERIEALIRSGEQFSEAALQQYYRAMMERPDRTAVLASNDLPVLFVIGTEDNAAPMNDLLQQVSLPAKSYIYILEEVGHMSMWEAAAELNRILTEFVTQ